MKRADTMNLKTNYMQVPTWSWLKINSAEVALGNQEIEEQKAPVIILPYGVQMGPLTAAVPQPPESLAPTVKAARESGAAPKQITIPAEQTIIEPIRIQIDLKPGDSLAAEHVHIQAEPGSSATVIVQLTGENLGGHCGLITCTAEEGARLHLIKAQMLGAGATHAHVILGEAAAGADLQILDVELGGATSASGCNVRLRGKESSGNLDCLYLGSGSATLDLNYRIAYEGALTEGDITVRGALADESRKTLRSTLDFITGAAGAKGREDEAVLALSDKVRNLSSPLLLCGEDDVEGQHATNTGRPDQEKLFYLMSRGLTENEACRLIVEASFTPILDKVADEALRDTMIQRIREVMRRD